MNNKKLKTISLLAPLLMFAGFSNAQESVNASGSNATGSGGNVAYSVGQVVYTTNTGSTGNVEQGVQHAYEIFTLGSNADIFQTSLSVFPNPATDQLILKVNDFAREKLSYQLLDAQGKLIAAGQVLEQQTHIHTAHLSGAVYFLNVFNQENNKIQSYKIIKN